MGCSSQLRLPPPSGRSTSTYSCPLPSAARPATVLVYSDFTTSAAAGCKNGKIFRCRRSRQVKSVLQSGPTQKPEEGEEEFQVLTAIQSSYNHIVILDTPKSRLLLLDSTHNVHSMLNKGSKWTGSYWDEFVTLPPVVPDGPIAIFGLGGGTAAHLLLDLWPSLQLEGWEIDEILIDKSRDYLGLCNLEKGNVDGGVLNIHIGDVFSPDAAISGGYAGIIVDLFSEGKVLPQLEEVLFMARPKNRFLFVCVFVFPFFDTVVAAQDYHDLVVIVLHSTSQVVSTALFINSGANLQKFFKNSNSYCPKQLHVMLQHPNFSIILKAATWLELYDKLMPNGRFMVNCGAADELPATDAISEHDSLSVDGTWKLNATIRALYKAFPGQVNWKKMPKSAGENYLALTGALPDLAPWSAALPNELKSSVSQWQTV